MFMALKMEEQSGFRPVFPCLQKWMGGGRKGRKNPRSGGGARVVGRRGRQSPDFFSPTYHFPLSRYRERDWMRMV